MIYVFGDSHRARFIHFDNHNNKVSRISSVGGSGLTAHGLFGGGKNPRGDYDGGIEGLANALKVIKPNDVMLFVLGEVDCRVHFYYHHKNSGTPIKELIATTIKRYGKAILLFKEYQIAVLDVIPAVRQGNAYHLEYYGSRKERASITIEFNRQLGEWCKKNNVPFIAIHHLLADDNGFLKKEYEVGDAHVSEDTVEFIALDKYFEGATWQ